MAQPDQLLDIHQAAEFLRVSETSLRRWTDEGRLACLRIGGRRERRFRVADLVVFMESEPAREVAASTGRSEAETLVVSVAGIPLPLGSHLVAFYASDEGRTNLAVAFLADGLGPESACFLVAAPAARKAVVARLEHTGTGLGRLVQSEYLPSLEAQVKFWEQSFVAATQAGARSLRVVGDLWSATPAISPEQIVRYEAEYDRTLARRFPVVTMCQYDVRRFSGVQLFEVMREHPDIFRYPAPRLLG